MPSLLGVTIYTQHEGSAALRKCSTLMHVADKTKHKQESYVTHSTDEICFVTQEVQIEAGGEEHEFLSLSVFLGPRVFPRRPQHQQQSCKTTVLLLSSIPLLIALFSLRTC